MYQESCSEPFVVENEDRTDGSDFTATRSLAIFLLSPQSIFRVKVGLKRQK